MLLSSLNRRRREMGLLKSLGFVRRQIALSVTWQTTTVAMIGIVLGVPLGIAAGRLGLGVPSRTNLGVVAVPVVAVLGRCRPSLPDAPGRRQRAGGLAGPDGVPRQAGIPAQGRVTLRRRGAVQVLEGLPAHGDAGQPSSTKTTAGRGTLL